MEKIAGQIGIKEVAKKNIKTFFLHLSTTFLNFSVFRKASPDINSQFHKSFEQQRAAGARARLLMHTIHIAHTLPHIDDTDTLMLLTCIDYTFALPIVRSFTISFVRFK